MSTETQPCAKHSNQAAAQPHETPPIPPLWTVREVARFARCSLRQVGYLRDEGLPSVKIGRLVRFHPPQVIAWLLRQAPASHAIHLKEVAL